MFKRMPLFALVTALASASIAQPVPQATAPSSQPSVPVPREVLERYVGRYELNSTVATVSLTDDGRLTIELTGQPKGPPLRAVSTNEFVADAVGVHIFFDGDGPKASRIRSQYSGGEVSGARIADDVTTRPHPVSQGAEPSRMSPGIASQEAQEARIDALFAGMNANTPGCAVGVERDGKTLLRKGYGTADLAGGRPLTPQTRVYMGSVSKQFTAMAILLLVKDGKLRLDDPIRKFIPELPAYADPVTIRQLLTHTGGMRDYFTLGMLNGAPGAPYTEASVLAVLKRQQGLNFQPGTDFLYSNTGYVLLAMVVQRASSMRLDDFARMRIFTPLGMTSSLFQHDHNNPLADTANGYVPRPGGGWQVANNSLDVVGDGGLYSNVDDMMHWLANLDSARVGAKAIQSMRVSAKLNDGSLTGYGMGLMPSRYRGLPLVSHSGSLAGYLTDAWWFPQQRLGIALLCNNATVPIEELSGSIAGIFLDGEMKPPTTLNATVPGEAARRYAGVYRDTRIGYVEFAWKDGQIVALNPERPLAEIVPGTFVFRASPDGPRTVFDADASALRIMVDGQRRVRAARVDKLDVGLAAGTAFVGDYESQEVSSPIRIRWAEGLQLASPGGGPLVSTGADRMWVPQSGTELVFTRDAGGQINGVILNQGRVRGVKFTSKPGPKPVARSAVALSEAEADRVVGRYQFGPDAGNLLLTVTRERGQVFEQLAGQLRLPVFAEAPLNFFSQGVDAQWRFEAEANGKVNRVVLFQYGREVVATRVESVPPAPN